MLPGDMPGQVLMSLLSYRTIRPQKWSALRNHVPLFFGWVAATIDAFHQIIDTEDLLVSMLALLYTS